jgi:hypothetical protein
MCEDFKNLFFFDMSIPEQIKYSHQGLRCLSRKSEIENLINLPRSGIWLDSLDAQPSLVKELSTKTLRDELIVVVSPELHGNNYLDFWEAVNRMSQSENFYLCTDYPLELMKFTND